MSCKRAFITGLEGFTGSYLAKELESNGYEVFGTVYKKPSDQFGFECDISDTKTLQELISDVKPNLIINLAGISSVDHDSAQELYQVNQLGTLSLLEAVMNSGHIPFKILLAGSAHIYGTQEESPITEECLPRPNSDYAISKLAMEQLAGLWFDRLPIIITRAFNYTGAGQSLVFLPAKIVNHYVLEEPEIELGNLDIARDWTDVRDIVSIYRRLLESNVHSKILNVCSGVSHSLRYILDTMSVISGHTLSIKVNPAFVRHNEIKDLRGDNSKLFSILGQINARSLQETLSWMYFARHSSEGS